MYAKNQTVTVTITDISTEGAGIGKVDGFPLFIKDALPADEIEARIVKVKKNYAYARVEKVIKPSPFRVEPACQHARRCGGCQIMEMDYQKQLEFKADKVRNNLIRIGGFDSDFITSIEEPVVASEHPLRYRNKAQFPFGLNKEGQIVSGFYAGRTHSIISCDDCQLGVRENGIIIEKIIEYMNEAAVSPYEEETGHGLIRHALIRKGFATGELMVCLVINGDKLPMQEMLLEKLTGENIFDGLDNPGKIISISISVNKKKTNVIMGDNYKTIWGKDTISDVMRVKNPDKDFNESYDENGITYEISPLSFYQVNPYQVEKLYGIALQYAGLTGEEEVWDICCGIGTITLSMASKAKVVHGLEIVPQAIDDARANAARNNIANADFVCAAAEEYLPDHKSEIKADVIVLDPPRKGMDERALQVVAETAPDRIVYVSCDSATLARDLKYLCERGYELKRFRAVDMFSQSVHVESVVLMSRKDKGI